MKIGEMMHLVANWPEGCLFLLLRMTCGVVSNGTVSVYLTLHAQAQGRTWLHPHKGSWGQGADVADYIDYNMHNYFTHLLTIALSSESLCSA